MRYETETETETGTGTCHEGDEYIDEPEIVNLPKGRKENDWRVFWFLVVGCWFHRVDLGFVFCLLSFVI